MIIFLEGLQGSGKSYNAVKEYILPYLQKGGRVVTNIKGMNHEYIANFLEIPLDDIKARLTAVPWDETHQIPETCGNDALVVIDELQDFWPQKSKLSPEHLAFITQHRQRGLELVTMGQVATSCHPEWRRRINRKIVFMNQDGIGRPTKFLSTTFNGRLQTDGRGQTSVVFDKVSDGGGTYEEKYWKCYQSVVEGVENTERPKDDRFNVLKTKSMRIYIPLFICLCLFAGNYAWGFLHGDKKVVNLPQTQKQAATVAPQAAPVKPVSQPQANIEKPALADKDVKPKDPPKPLDYIQDLIAKYRPRQGGLLKMGNKEDGVIEFLDSGYRAQERIKLSELHNFGWQYQILDSVVIISHGDETHFVTAWPVEPFGQTSVATRNDPAISGKL